MRLVIISAAVLLPSSFAFAQEISFTGMVNGVGHVFVANLGAGGGVTQLTSGPDTDQAAEWSFNGSQLVFQRNGSDVHGYAIMVMNANGTGLKDISPSIGQDLLPSWTTGGQILFSQVIQPPTAATMGVPVTALMIMNANGSGRKALVTPSAKSIGNLAPFESPNGKEIAFECGPAFNAPMQICEINSNGTGFKYLTDLQGAASADPHWSPDGSKIIFDSTRAGGVNLFSMNPDGSDVTQLTNFAEPQEGQDASYSSDKSVIAFEWDNGGNYAANANAPAALWIMNSNGTNQQSLGIPCDEFGLRPSLPARVAAVACCSVPCGAGDSDQHPGTLNVVHDAARLCQLGLRRLSPSRRTQACRPNRMNKTLDLSDVGRFGSWRCKAPQRT